ncbi:Alpha/beta hydrolase fold-1 [Talaromyces proteolyticus]|uniref:Alpha/beta hydrolase fold-1 n=1 Tax=Talaromyces proteolyticus TaxID=1131652 RepID=A0AAD4KT50_9EURO|nr:Alpha/beta hydrolase fold-1 [Talaromyces proteolyticus]KAH8698761.1 Alpha/beta hydrolase fold-1 [Talaromyces proteolyticus]
MSSPQGKKPTILFVPGSFCPPFFYTSVSDALERDGYETVIEPLLSANRAPPDPAATMYEDASILSSRIATLCDENKDVVLVMHSYGGVVGSEASKGLSKKGREAAGKKGGITKLIYVTAVVPEIGQSLKDVMGDLLPSHLIVEGEYMSHVIEPSAAITFSDIPLDEGVEWVKKMSLHSVRSFAEPLTYAGYMDIPSTFIFCEQDQILPLDFQRRRVQTIERCSGHSLATLSLVAGHCPNVSRPIDLAKTIQKALVDS